MAGANKRLFFLEEGCRSVVRRGGEGMDTNEN